MKPKRRKTEGVHPLSVRKRRKREEDRRQRIAETARRRGESIEDEIRLCRQLKQYQENLRKSILGLNGKEWDDHVLFVPTKMGGLRTVRTEDGYQKDIEFWKEKIRSTEDELATNLGAQREQSEIMLDCCPKTRWNGSLKQFGEKVRKEYGADQKKDLAERRYKSLKDATAKIMRRYDLPEWTLPQVYNNVKQCGG